MQIIILGMHRSGTSVISRLLNMMGAYFGPEGMITGANIENPKGFWERKDIRKANDKLLHMNNLDWNRIAKFDIQNLSEDSINIYQKEVANIILNMDANRPWFVKDPRLCLFFYLWKDLLEVPVCLHVIRNPLEVASSLKKRNEIPISTGISLWEKYNIFALRYSAGLSRFIVSYNDILADPGVHIRQLANNLSEMGVYGIRVPSNREICSFIDNNLHHHIDRNDKYREYLNHNQKKLYQLLSRGSIFNNDYHYHISSSCTEELNQYESDLSCIKSLKKIIHQTNNEIDKKEKKLLQFQEDRKSEYVKLTNEINKKEKKLLQFQEDRKSEKAILKTKINESVDQIKFFTNLIDLLFDDFKKLFGSKIWKCLYFISHLKYRLSFRQIPPTIKDHISKLEERYKDKKGSM